MIPVTRKLVHSIIHIYLYYIYIYIYISCFLYISIYTRTRIFLYVVQWLVKLWSISSWILNKFSIPITSSYPALTKKCNFLGPYTCNALFVTEISPLKYTFLLCLLGCQLTMWTTPVTPTTSSRPSSMRGFSKRLSLSEPQRSAPEPQLCGEHTSDHLWTCGLPLGTLRGALLRVPDFSGSKSHTPWSPTSWREQFSCIVKAGTGFLKFGRIFIGSFSHKRREVNSFHWK